MDQLNPELADLRLANDLHPAPTPGSPGRDCPTASRFSTTPAHATQCSWRIVHVTDIRCVLVAANLSPQHITYALITSAHRHHTAISCDQVLWVSLAECRSLASGAPATQQQQRKRLANRFHKRESNHPPSAHLTCGQLSNMYYWHPQDIEQQPPPPPPPSPPP
eukprot:CAMPEP_0174719564 /NCGR_PEP_ID=MMETSP1094-20130205/31408_1 /TAXON_ID=156173 /ORGANISM="Chrysochromulina brevifilum, Strain UTEX LB 985" /LENGTH=163 /DNA_ID=CAMNT_0015919881 /DNA_START=63 /DNA_END=550 /DNA_ORIENTATION=-